MMFVFVKALVGSFTCYRRKKQESGVWKKKLQIKPDFDHASKLAKPEVVLDGSPKYSIFGHLVHKFKELTVKQNSKIKVKNWMWNFQHGNHIFPVIGLYTKPLKDQEC